MDCLDSRERPLDAVCDDILERYHAPLQRSLTEVRHDLAACAALSPSAGLDRLQSAFVDLAALVEAHFAKEENLLFPAVEALSRADRAGATRPPLPFPTILNPIRLMEAEHVRIEARLDALRELALEVDAPEAQSVRWRRSMAELLTLDTLLREHHRYENEVFFPLALDLERRVL